MTRTAHAVAGGDVMLPGARCRARGASAVRVTGTAFVVPASAPPALRSGPDTWPCSSAMLTSCAPRRGSGSSPRAADQQPKHSSIAWPPLHVHVPCVQPSLGHQTAWQAQSSGAQSVVDSHPQVGGAASGGSAVPGWKSAQYCPGPHAGPDPQGGGGPGVQTTHHRPHPRSSSFGHSSRTR